MLTAPSSSTTSLLVEKLARFDRERVPERSPHAKGSGAFGEFEVTEDVSQYTKADFLQPGAKTQMLARFSTVAGELGSPDTWRDVRGFRPEVLHRQRATSTWSATTRRSSSFATA